MTDPLRILALNPHHGGSHKAFLDGWIEHSAHDFDVLTLPPYKWKWRMRHAAVTFAEQLRERHDNEGSWDALFCTDMLNLAELLGLCPPEIHELPRVVYFHENQLTYPNREDRERDLHFAFTNITTGLAADRVWFNSAFHRDQFVTAVDEWMRRMPDYQLVDAAAAIFSKAAVHPPGIADSWKEIGSEAVLRDDSPIRILWVSRWEHDKDPDTFFAALRRFKEHGEPFRLNVLGESFGNVPPIFEQAKAEFAEQIDHWGFAATRNEYERVLRNSDVVVSTAKHEFFGIAVLEAVAAGCFPLVPRALAYPEVLGDNDDFFHDGTSAGLADRMVQLSDRIGATGSCWPGGHPSGHLVEQHRWPARAAEMDDSLARLAM